MSLWPVAFAREGWRAGGSPETAPASAGRSLLVLKAALREDMGWHIEMTFFWNEQSVGEVFGLRWQPGSPWSPVPYQYTSAAEHLATSQKWSLRLYFPHCQILNNRPVTCNTCCKSVSVRVWTSGVLVLYTTSLIHCSLSGSLHSSCAKWSSVLIGSVKYISPIEREVPPDKYSSH